MDAMADDGLEDRRRARFTLSLINSGTWISVLGYTAEEAVISYVTECANSAFEYEWNGMERRFDLREGTFTFLVTRTNDAFTARCRIDDVQSVTVRVTPPVVPSATVEIV